MAPIWQLCLLIFFLTAPLPLAAATSHRPLTIISEEWPPYNYTEDQKVKGLATEVVQLILKDLGLKEKITLLPDARALDAIKTSKRTIFFSMIYTPERKNLFKWIGPFAEQSISFYKRKGSPLKIQTLEDAKKVSAICARSNGLVFNTLKNAGFKNLDVAVNAEGIYLKTIYGRCDLAIGEAPLGVIEWLKKSHHPLDSLEKTPLKLLDFSLYIVATKDISDAEVAEWQQSLNKIKASKEYLRLQEKYN